MLLEASDKCNGTPVNGPAVQPISFYSDSFGVRLAASGACIMWIQIRAVILNGFTVLGMPRTAAVG
jgi:hypothetical protein